MTASASSTIDSSPSIDELFQQLMRIEGKAEIVDGGIELMSPAGAWPSLVALEIAFALRSYVRKIKRGYVVGDNAIFRVDLPNRKSFSPDAAYFLGPPAKMEPFDGAPVFAVEVRSFGDYGPAAERHQAKKRNDYFACGTQVVWDVDLLSNEVIRSYSATQPETPVIFRPGEIAHAEPAVPGWTVAVHDILPDDWTPSETGGPR
jgi:Uma2 family endonuclease